MNRDGVLLIVSVAFCMGLGAQTGGVRGRLSAEGTGEPLAGATVVAVRQSADAAEGLDGIRQVVTDVEGGFSVDGLPPGVWRFCMHEAGDRLDPCQWSQDIRADVGATTSTLDIRLRRGVRLAVRVQDTEGLVATLKAGSPALAAVPGALVSITLADSTGRHMLLPLTHASGRLYEYSALVPPDTDLTLHVGSLAFALATASGQTVGRAGISIPLRVSVSPPRDPRVRLPFMTADPQVHVVALAITGLAQALP